MDNDTLMNEECAKWLLKIRSDADWKGIPDDVRLGAIFAPEGIYDLVMFMNEELKKK